MDGEDILTQFCTVLPGLTERSEALRKVVALKSETDVDLVRILRWLILRSRRTSIVVFLMGDAVITNHDDTCSVRSFRTRTEHGHKILNCNELLPPGMNVRAEDLRYFFVLLELITYKIVHFAVKGGQQGYDIEDESFAARLRMLERSKLVGDKSLATLREIKAVRNKFSHTISSVRRIEYFGVPLEDCFRRSPDESIQHWFKEEAFDATEDLISIFKRHQHEQVDVGLLVGAAEEFLDLYRAARIT